MPDDKDASDLDLAQEARGRKSGAIESTKSRVGKPSVLGREIHDHIKGRGLVSSASLGISDGLISNLAFLAGFAGAGSPITEIRLAGAAAMIAGAVSMFFGGILAGRAERDLFGADSRREAEEIEKEPEEERQELRNYYLQKGLSTEEVETVVNRVTSDRQKWLEDILIHELHIHETVLVNPYKMGSTIGLAFLLGAFVPLAPYLFLSTVEYAIYVSILLSLVFLFLVGAWKGMIVKKSRMRSGLEMLLIGVVASILLYGLGHLLVFA